MKLVKRRQIYPSHMSVIVTLNQYTAQYEIVTFSLDPHEIKRLWFWQRLNKEHHSFELILTKCGSFKVYLRNPVYLKKLYPNEVTISDTGDLSLSQELYLELLMLVS